MKTIITTLTIIFLACALPGLNAQEILHAVTGTVTNNGHIKQSLIIQKSDQSSEVFEVGESSFAPVTLDKAFQNNTETVDKLPKGTSHVIVYYYGLSPETAVAVEDIGDKVLLITGRVSHVDKKQHTIAIRADGGSESVCSVESGTAVEMSDGVKDGAKNYPSDGDRITAVCTEEAGKEAARFIKLL
jgi:hypothetical protein